MANTGKQSPLGVNVLGSLLANTGFTINPVAASFMGASKINDDYSFGKLVNDTALRLLTYSINDGYIRGPADSNTTLTDTTYNNLIAIGTDSLGALGNSKPPTYVAEDPAGVWQDLGYPATTGYPIAGNTDQGQEASWLPYDTTNPNKSVTQWGYLRLHALQAWNEFNYNGDPEQVTPTYSQFCGSFMSCAGFIGTMNSAIMAVENARSFMDGSYSNMNDLTSADVAGINLSSKQFGQDLENLGRAINLKRIDAFGLPSVLLATLGKSSAVTQDLSLALLASGLSNSDIQGLTSGSISRPSVDQERKIYGAFLLITGENLKAVLSPLQCTTQGMTSLADMLNVKKLFPNSYSALTVPKYNSERGLPTNSKTYYLIYQNGGVNSGLDSPAMQDYVGLQIPRGQPPRLDKSLSAENYVAPKKGFGSYLKGILPDDQAIAAGAFQFAMRQIRKIDQLDFKKFSKAVKGMENMEGLPLTAGSSKPTNQQAIDHALEKMALGSGPFGTFTMSDTFGCMSGLPYPWQNLYERIKQLENQKLKNIYQQLFLAVTWEPATATATPSAYYTNVQQYIANAANPDYPAIDPVNPYLQCGTGTPTTNPCCQPRIDNCYYTLGISTGGLGGGYGRGTAPVPNVTISPNTGGASLPISIGTDDTNAGSDGQGTFGRVIFGTPNTGSAVMYKTVTNSSNNNPPDLSGADAPPTVTITIECPPTDTLPVAANGDISTLGTNTPSGTVGWNSPMNAVVQAYIDQANATILEIEQSNPEKAEYLKAYWNGLGAQLQLEQRTRCLVGPPVEIPSNIYINPYPITTIVFTDSMPSYSQDTRPHMTAQTIEAISDFNEVGGQSAVGMMRQERNQSRILNAGIELDNNIPAELNGMQVKTLTTNGTIFGGKNNAINGYTNPSWLVNTLAGNNLVPIPEGVYIPTDTELLGTFVPTSSTAPGDITALLQAPNAPGVVPTAASRVAVGPSPYTPIERPVIIQPPAELDPSNTPTNLNVNYTSTTLLPSSPSVRAAIDQVVECNCDCWLD